MYQITCAGCQTAYKVSRSMEGQRLKCKKCGHAIRVTRAALVTESDKKSQAAYAFVALGVVVVVILVAILASGGDQPPVNAEPRDRDGSAATANLPSADVESPPSVVSSAFKNTAEHRVLSDFVAALRDFDAHRLMAGLYLNRLAESYEPAKEVLGGKSYSDLDEIGRKVFQQDFSMRLFSDDVRRPFQNGVVKAVEGPADRADGDTEYTLVLVDPKGRESRFRFALTRVSSVGWLIADIEEVIDEAALAAKAAEEEAAAGPRDGIGERRLDDGRIVLEGTIEPVPPLEDTPEEVLAEIRSNVAILSDLTKTREANIARNKLVQIGKPAIPLLLSKIAEENVEDPEGVLVINQIDMTLREITGEHFGFAPQMGLAAATGGDTPAQFKLSPLRQWFAWWKRNKDTFEVAKPVEEEPRPRRRGGKK